MQNWPRHVPHADRPRRIRRKPIRRESTGWLERRGIHASHGTSQRRLAKPSVTKNGRHPKRATTTPPSRIPSAGPRDRPAINIALGNPRRFSTKWLPRILEQEGNTIDSPTPKITRITIKATNPCKVPVTAVAADHTKKPAPNTHFTSKRSTNHPAGICISP